MNEKIGDPTGEATAQMNLADLRRTLGLELDGAASNAGQSEGDDDGLYGADKARQRRLSMERMDLLKVCLRFLDRFSARLSLGFIFVSRFTHCSLFCYVSHNFSLP